MSKWRRYQARAQVEVFCDYLAERGVWPFVRAKWKPRMSAMAAHLLDFRGEDTVFLREIFGDISWLLPDPSSSKVLYAGTPVRLVTGPPDEIVSAYGSSSMTVTSVDRDLKRITLSGPTGPIATGRRPTFIPVRRLDGRRSK